MDLLFKMCIENFAIIKKVNIQFENGLNVLTGETGSGKSIIIMAINSVIGGRCSKNIIRYGSSIAKITALFTNISSNILNICENIGIELEYKNIELQRCIFSDGRTTAKINGKLISISNLKNIGHLLINLNEQNSNIDILSSTKQLEIIDIYSNTTKLYCQFKNSYYNLKNINKKLNSIDKSNKLTIENISKIKTNIAEIEKSEIHMGEDIKLENLAKSMRNFEYILNKLNNVHTMLFGDHELGIINLLNKVANDLEDASEYYDEIQNLSKKFCSIFLEFKDISYEISNILDNFSYNPQKLHDVENRLNTINKLKQKYGPTYSDILNHLKEFKDQIKTLEKIKKTRDHLIQSVKLEKTNLKKLATQISEIRRESSKKFALEIENELKFLDMPESKFRVNVTENKLLNINGMENIEFLISTNVGEPLKPFSKIVSGGEISRILLSIKNILAEKDSNQTIIFDEIDSGVSGSTARKIGFKLKQAAKNRQVICVTHSAQIASIADQNFKIFKFCHNNETFSEVEQLDCIKKIKEIARIISAGPITKLTMKTAQEMINQSKMNL